MRVPTRSRKTGNTARGKARERSRCGPTLQSGLAAAVLVVDPKDEQAARFYYRYGFLDIGPGRTRLL
jgi:hypothetical protein